MSADNEVLKEWQERAELLTDAEHDLIRRLGEIWNDLIQIMNDGGSFENDLHEAMFHIHGLQKMVMGQAAARAYPSMYRPLGGWGKP